MKSKKLRWGIILAFFVFLISFVTSCKTVNMSDVAALGYTSMASNPNYSPQQRAAAAVISKLYAIDGQRQHELNVAQEGRAQINLDLPPNIVRESEGKVRPTLGFKWVAPNDPNDFRVAKVDDNFFYNYNTGEQVTTWVPLPNSFVCMGFGDKNGDGFIGKDELIQLGSSFEFKPEQEKLQLSCGSKWDGNEWGNMTGRRVLGKVTNISTKKVVFLSEVGLAGYTAARWIYPEFEKANMQGIKEYLLEWYVEGRHIPNRSIHFFVDYGN